jgi:hypothetical protein
MSVIVLFTAPLFAHLSFNCLLYVLRLLLCFSLFVIIIIILIISLFNMFCFLFCVFCVQFSFSSLILSFLSFMYECKDHYHWVETQLQQINIVSNLESSRMKRPWPALGRSATERIALCRSVWCSFGHSSSWLS